MILSRVATIFLFFLASYLSCYAADTIYVCNGTVQEFGVPNSSGSTYFWEVDNSSVASIVSGSNSELVTIKINSADIFKLFVTETDINGCIGADSIVVIAHSLPNPIIISDEVNLCDGDSVLIELNFDASFNSFLWNNNDTEIFTYASDAGSFFVTVTDTNGCSKASNSIDVNVYSDVMADFSIYGTCISQPSLFINQSIYDSEQLSQIYWNIEGNYFSGDSIYYIFNEVGLYNISLGIQTYESCFDSVSKSVKINANPVADFAYSPKDVSILNPQVNFFNNSINAYPLSWDFGDDSFDISANPVHAYSDPGIYDVLLVVSDSNQCIDSIYKEVIVYYDFILHVPNAFTPNDDSDNDVFGVEGIRMEKYQSFELIIFNSWGEKVYQTNDISKPWDGGDNPADVYTWLLVIEDELGQIRKRNGLVNLIR